MVIDVNNVFVVYTDSHFALVHADNQEAARNLQGKVLGHYLSSDKANEALATMRTIAAFGYGHTLRTKGE